jgi:hypothetical protein
MLMLPLSKLNLNYKKYYVDYCLFDCIAYDQKWILTANKKRDNCKIGPVW